jgi:GNAT superfamily N-acetyltransferase
MSLVLDDVVVPVSLDGPGGERFRAYVEVRNTVEAEVVGTHLLTPAAGELLPEYRTHPDRRRRLVAAQVDGTMVGRAMVTTRPRSPGAGAYVVVDVLPAHRGRGVGSALLERVESAAHEVGERIVKASVAHTVRTPGPRIPSPTGFGDVPADDPGVRFLRRHGYSLEQVVRISVLDTAGLGPRLAPLRTDAEAAAGDAYRLHDWIGPTPARWLDGLAVLRTRMSTAAPMAGLQALPDPWDAQRVVAHDRRAAESGSEVVTAAVEHVSTGRLVAMTEVVVPPRRTAAIQEDTLVLDDHRGHRLGTLLKVVNAGRLVRHAPHVEAVVTWNAEENRPMLDVNEAMGFRAIGLEGGWQKRT